MIRLCDIAEKAGVSVSVVSRVLNPKPDKNAFVAEKTRLRVLKIAARMGYRPNRSAEFLKRGGTPTLGVFLPTHNREFVFDILRGINDEAALKNFPLSLSFGMEARQYVRFLDETRTRKNCAIITYPPFNLTPDVMKSLDSFANHGGNLVLINAESSFEGIPVVRMNGCLVGKLAARRLVNRGCKSFFLTGWDYGGRHQGFAEEMDREQNVFHNYADFKKDSGVFLKELKSRQTLRPIGVFATSDIKAITIMSALKDSSLRVGEDIMLIGCDNISTGPLLSPSLTTFSQPFYDMGRLAARKAINMIYGKKEKGIVLDPELIIRESA